MQKLKKVLPWCGACVGGMLLFGLLMFNAGVGDELTLFGAFFFCAMSILVTMPFWIWNLLQAKRGRWWKSMVTYWVLSVPTLLIMTGVVYMCSTIVAHNINSLMTFGTWTPSVTIIAALGVAGGVLSFLVFLDGLKRPKP